MDGVTGGPPQVSSGGVGQENVWLYVTNVSVHMHYKNAGLLMQKEKEFKCVCKKLKRGTPLRLRNMCPDIATKGEQ